MKVEAISQKCNGSKKRQNSKHRSQSKGKLQKATVTTVVQIIHLRNVQHTIKLVIHVSWPENQGILFFYIFQTFQMNRISFMASHINAVL